MTGTRILTDNKTAIWDAYRMARRVVLWCAAVEGCSRPRAIRIAAKRFNLVESNLRTLFTRPQTLKTVSHPMFVNLRVAEQILLDQVTKTKQLTKPPELESELVTRAR